MTTSAIHLLAIDPQNDFCDLPPELCPADPSKPGVHMLPALPVAGAHGDMQRLAQFISRAGRAISRIHVTLDSHNPVDIAHPGWWIDADGDHPAPFTVISPEDIANGTWRTANRAMQEYSHAYATQLAAGGRYPLVVWPEHCLIGSWGHNIHPSVKAALDKWGRERMEVVDFIHKGANPKTEHYSAVRAEVPDPDDPSTLLNTRLISTLEQAGSIIIAGEALSHCVANTVRDIADNFGESSIRKMVLLTDCSSSVAGYEKLGQTFVEEMAGRGMRIAKSTDLLF